VAFASYKTLLEVLREDLGHTGTKHGCEPWRMWGLRVCCWMARRCCRASFSVWNAMGKMS
jgi:hypothetical protein